MQELDYVNSLVERKKLDKCVNIDPRFYCTHAWLVHISVHTTELG